MRSIAEMLRFTGPTAGALRFHDGAGVLAPGRVTPLTGHRQYADEQVKPGRARVSLRWGGVPLAEIGRVPGALGDPAAADRFLAGSGPPRGRPDRCPVSNSAASAPCATRRRAHANDHRT